MTDVVQVTNRPTVVLEAVCIETGTSALLLTTPVVPDPLYPAVMEMAESSGWLYDDHRRVLRPDWRVTRWG